MQSRIKRIIFLIIYLEILFLTVSFCDSEKAFICLDIIFCMKVVE